MPLFGHKLFGPKKTRTSRTIALRPSSSLSRRLDGVLRNRGVLLRLMLCAVAIAGLLMAVESWKAPFPYRLGDRDDHGITARLDFQRVNRFETQRVQSDREAMVPYIFVHDPEPLRNLPARLRNSFNEVAQAPELQDLPHPTRIAFGLTRGDSLPAPAGPMPEEWDHDFRTLQAAIAMEDEATGNRIDDLIAEFERFIAPLRETGLADPQELAELEIPPDGNLAVVISTNVEGATASDPQQWRLVSPADVRIGELLKDTGELGKSWREHSELVVIRPHLERWLLSQAPATLRYDGAATQQARREARNIEPEYDKYYRGDLLVEPGRSIDPEALEVLQAEHDQMEQQVGHNQRIARTITVFLMLLVLAGLNGYYLVRNEPRIVRNIGRLSIYLVAIVLAVVLGRALSLDPWRAEVIPLTATVMIFAIAYNQVLAMMIGFTLTLVITVSTVGDLRQFVVLMSVAAMSLIPLARVPSRTTLIKVGFWSGLVYFVVAWGTGIVQSHSTTEIWSDTTLLLNSLRGAGWCLVAGYLVAGSLPFIEKAFGVVTDISLLEMSDVSHPLLKELVRRAPGTYNHSIAVASLGETAADSIGANGLLVRVGAYFHDIGKMLKPHYFIENITDFSESRHQRLAPAMSTLIIIGHVKDGADLARQHNLPEPLVDFIEQHHGTTLVEYFYREAARQAGQQPDHKYDAHEPAFRYPGPKPQTREAGVLMLADAVESACRSLSEPAPKRIESLVKEITLKRLLDGQFDECSLTLCEIHTIEQSLTKSLIGIYHGRIKYPEQRTA